jgi:ABC-type Fe3+-hydroxamate transport system substrate-binding protein
MILSERKFPYKKYNRIISLVPSQTELLAYLGLDIEVIGITKFCIHPDEWYRNKTRIGGTKKINLKTIDELSPDLIIANKEENVKEQVEALAERYDVWVSDVNNLSDALQMIKDIGKLTGKSQQTNSLACEIRKGFKKIKVESAHKRKIPTAYFIWKDPYMVAGGDTFINDMMSYCGMENVFSDRSRYPEITFDNIKEEKTELILLSSEPYPFQEKQLEQIQKYLPGIKIKLTDGEMFSWYGSRLLKSIDYFHSFLNI